MHGVVWIQVNHPQNVFKHSTKFKISRYTNKTGVNPGIVLNGHVARPVLIAIL